MPDGSDSRAHVSRREFLQASVAGVAAAGLQRSPSQRTAMTGIKALVFDVFGTVVDWRTSVAREVDTVAKAKGIKIDGAAFADAWRAQYAPMMDQVRTGKLPWTKLDRLHRMILDQIVDRFGMGGLSEAERASLTLAWHRLQPWPDSVPGLTRLKKRFILAPMSNGNIALIRPRATCRLAMGLHPRRRARAPLQAGPRGLSIGLRVPRTEAR